MPIDVSFTLQDSDFEQVFKQVAASLLSINSYNEPRGSLAPTVINFAQQAIEKRLSANDYALLYQYVENALTSYLQPTIERLVEEKIKTEARKALKNAKISNAELLG